MDDIKMFTQEDSEYIYTQIKRLLDTKIVYLSYAYNKVINDRAFEIMLEFDYHGNKANLLKDLFFIKRVNWFFNCSSDEFEIIQYIKYPWNVHLSLLFESYIEDRIEFTDLVRYFELLNKNIPILESFIQSKFESEYRGTDKWIEAAKTWVNSTKNILNTIFKNIKVKDVFYEEGSAKKHYFTVTYTFTDYISYVNKRRLIDDLNNKMLPIYNKINQYACKSMYQCQNIIFNFNDNGKKCNNADQLIFQLRSNKWNALGMAEEAQFIPKMGMHKKNIQL